MEDAGRLDNVAVCISCKSTIPEKDAAKAGWKWATFIDGEPTWMCLECVTDEVESERSAARWG